MRILIALLVMWSCSFASAGEVGIEPWQRHQLHPYTDPVSQRCYTYQVPVSNYYYVIRDPYSGYIYSREYIGTRYEQRTYCTPRGRYHILSY